MSPGNPCDGLGEGECSATCDEAANACTYPVFSPCDDGNECTSSSSCTSNGICGNQFNVANGTPCTSDGLFCNGAEECQSGSCVAPGDPCDGPDGDGDCSETCDETADACTGNDPFGSLCDDGEECTSSSSCTDNGICGNQFDVANGTPCTSDGLFCNGAEECQSGSCVSPGDPCGGPDGDLDCSESCSESVDACTANDPDGSACPSDGSFCNGPEQCQAGVCTGSGDPCSGGDGDLDCSESCDDGTDSCTAPDPNGSSCDDGLFCTATDECQAGNCVGAGDPCVGPDGDANCSESCDETADSCSAPDPDSAICQAGDVVGLLVRFSGTLDASDPPFAAGDFFEIEAQFTEPVTSLFEGATYVPGSLVATVNGSPLTTYGTPTLASGLFFSGWEIVSCVQLEPSNLGSEQQLCLGLEVPGTTLQNFLDQFPIDPASPHLESASMQTIRLLQQSSTPASFTDWSISLVSAPAPAPVPAMSPPMHILMSLCLGAIAAAAIVRRRRL